MYIIHVRIQHGIMPTLASGIVLHSVSVDKTFNDSINGGESYILELNSSYPLTLYHKLLHVLIIHRVHGLGHAFHILYIGNIIYTYMQV